MFCCEPDATACPTRRLLDIIWLSCSPVIRIKWEFKFSYFRSILGFRLSRVSKECSCRAILNLLFNLLWMCDWFCFCLLLLTGLFQITLRIATSIAQSLHHYCPVYYLRCPAIDACITFVFHMTWFAPLLPYVILQLHFLNNARIKLEADSYPCPAILSS